MFTCLRIYSAEELSGQTHIHHQLRAAPEHLNLTRVDTRMWSCECVCECVCVHQLQQSDSDSFECLVVFKRLSTNQKASEEGLQTSSSEINLQRC